MGAKIRHVSASDMNNILEISRCIWDGHDYLPSVINDWLKDPDAYTYGVEVDKRLVAVANLRLVENNQTGWMEGLRVHPDYRGKGFADALTEHVMQKAETIGVQRLRYTTGTGNEASLRLAEKFGFTKVLEMGVFWHPNPKILLLTGKHPHIRESNPNEVYELLQNNPRIIPHGILFYDWKALDSTFESIKTIGKSHEFYIALKEGKMTSLSYAYPRYDPEQPMWAFTVYATEPKGFLAHLSHNIVEASKLNISAIMGTYEPRFKETLHSLNWISKDSNLLNLVLLEKTLG